jgi:hypothetical protein
MRLLARERGLALVVTKFDATKEETVRGVYCALIRLAAGQRDATSPSCKLSTEREMTKLPVYVVTAALLAAASFASAGSASAADNQWMAQPSAADSAVRARVMAAATAAPAAVQRSDQGEAAQGGSAGPMTAAMSSKPVANAAPPK